MEQFKLPRDDWFDEDGRIYKDALIENFNAIEKAFQELTDLGAIDIQDINWDNVHLENVTLSSPDDNIVNLDSLLNIMHIGKMYFNEQFSGKTCVSIDYFKDGKIVHLRNKTLSGLAAGDFVWLSVANNNLEVVKPANLDSKLANDTTGILVGQFVNGLVQSKGYGKMVQYDILEVLAKMKVTPVKVYTGKRASGQPVVRTRVNGRIIGVTEQNKKAGSFEAEYSVMPDIGYEGDGVR